jgi:predicted lipid-binding transport protein (Tim44 family)
MGTAGGDRLRGGRSFSRHPRCRQNLRCGEFFAGAVAAYEAVLTAFAEADVGVLADLASADVYGPFVAAIAEREKQGEWVEWRLLSVETVKIADAALVERSASITVRFSSQFITYIRRANGDLVDAAGESVVDVTDDWTFARELLGRTPNWKLIATGSA